MQTLLWSYLISDFREDPQHLFIDGWLVIKDFF